MRKVARAPWLLFVAATLGATPAAAAVTFDWVTVGDAGNACDPQGTGRCFGAVGYTYRMATHEVTNAQYVEFLNAKAAADPLGLYSTDMATWGGIMRSGSPGAYTYGAIPGREQKPVFVGLFDALRFVNWLHNGQGNGGTETGAYTLLGGTATPTNPLAERNPGATVFLASDAEWYKAAYYDPGAGIYFDYPAGTDAQIVCSTPSAAGNRANCGGVAQGLTDVGSYPGSPSPNGTFDQGGNIAEWTDTLVFMDMRAVRGGSAGSPAGSLRGQIQEYDEPGFEGYGFRVASLEGTVGTVCGDGVCESPENALTCPGDCPTLCGDGLCSGDESPLSCSADCPHQCGDGLCSGAENVFNCSPDCGFCGDDVCDPSENASTCAVDCGPVCGDAIVEGTEQCEAGVPLADSCTSLGFRGGTLACHTSTCLYNTSTCTSTSCLRWMARCSNDAQCCSGDCRSGRCRN
jgi:formylglycine-generating enzyme